MTDEISKYQPLILSLILNFHEEFGKTQITEELVKNYLIIWEFFKTKGIVRKKQVTEKMFNARMLEIAQFYKYFEGSTKGEQELLIKADNNNTKHKMLLFIINMRIQNSASLQSLTPEQRMNLGITNRCLIECLSIF